MSVMAAVVRWLFCPLIRGICQTRPAARCALTNCLGMLGACRLLPLNPTCATLYYLIKDFRSPLPDARGSRKEALTRLTQCVITNWRADSRPTFRPSIRGPLDTLVGANHKPIAGCHCNPLLPPSSPSAKSPLVNYSANLLGLLHCQRFRRLHQPHKSLAISSSRSM